MFLMYVTARAKGNDNNYQWSILRVDDSFSTLVILKRTKKEASGMIMYASLSTLQVPNCFHKPYAK